jgi:hypothetical protein
LRPKTRSILLGLILKYNAGHFSGGFRRLFFVLSSVQNPEMPITLGTALGIAI